MMYMCAWRVKSDEWWVSDVAQGSYWIQTKEKNNNNNNNNNNNKNKNNNNNNNNTHNSHTRNHNNLQPIISAT